MAEEDQTHVSRVDFALGQTIGLKNFSSVRIDVGVSIPCGNTPEAREAALAEAEEFCAPRLIERRDKVLAWARSQGLLHSG